MCESESSVMLLEVLNHNSSDKVIVEALTKRSVENLCYLARFSELINTHSIIMEPAFPDAYAEVSKALPHSFESPRGIQWCRHAITAFQKRTKVEFEVLTQLISCIFHY